MGQLKTGFIADAVLLNRQPTREHHADTRSVQAVINRGAVATARTADDSLITA